MRKPTLANGHANGSSYDEPPSPDSGFLTKAQQEILDAAVLEKQQSAHLETAQSDSLEKQASRQQSIPRQNSVPLSPRAKDRASRARNDKNLGRPKKGGAGGKFNWGGQVELETASSGVQDPNDPNYDSECDADAHVTLSSAPASPQSLKFNSRVASIAKEYFLTGNTVEATAALQDLGQPKKAFYYAKKLVQLSMDYGSRERELTSTLLSTLYSTVISPGQMEEAFLLLLQGAEDLKLDVPQACEILAYFIARAITDDILPPAFVTHASSDGSDEASAQILRKAESLLKSPHAAERIQKCWGVDSWSTYAKLQQSIQNLIVEFYSSRDKEEAALCVHTIDCPLAMHELVKQALVHAMSGATQQKEAMLDLLGFLVTQGHISEDQLLKGFKRVQVNIDDLGLDILQAKQTFTELCGRAETTGWLPRAQLDSHSSHLHITQSLTLSLQAFKKATQMLLLEYYDSGDAAEAKQCLLDLKQSGFHSLVVKQMVQTAMDHREADREATAKLLCVLSPSIITRDQLALGFIRLLATVEDMTLDIPGADHQLALFLGRVIVDELLPPIFLTAALKSLNNNSRGIHVIQATGRMLSQRHAAERLQLCWHPVSDIQDLRDRIQEMVKEYVVTGDESEAGRCWRDLNVAFYGHQLIFAILLANFEQPGKHDSLIHLIQRFKSSGEVSETQIEMGFNRVAEQLEDLKLDYPSAGEQFPLCKDQATTKGWIESAKQEAAA